MLLWTDTEYRYTEAFNRVLSKYGKTWTWDLKAATMGFHIMEVAKFVVKTFDLPIKPEEFIEQVGPHYEELFPGSQSMPG